MERGIPLSDVYVEILAESMRRNGELWHTAQLTVDTEHYCTSVTQMAMAQLYPLPIHLSGRIGVYTGGEEEIPVEQMCDRARLALDTVGKQDGVKIAFYTRELHEKLLMEHRILDSVQDALENGEYKLYLQPKVDMVKDGEMAGAEALISQINIR